MQEKIEKRPTHGPICRPLSNRAPDRDTVGSHTIAPNSGEDQEAQGISLGWEGAYLAV